ncbi:MAG: hypothetical protein QOD74_1029 [Variibacter sp.]|jgi:chromosome segregation ATPase|nr:hypothetical protein [Variibacter sp.]
MNRGDAIEAATRRLATALDSLEAALERRRETDAREVELGAQIAALGADRSRLALQLDEQAARRHRLETTSRDVARRLDAAMASIRDLVAEEARS